MYLCLCQLFLEIKRKTWPTTCGCTYAKVKRNFLNTRSHLVWSVRTAVLLSMGHLPVGCSADDKTFCIVIKTWNVHMRVVIRIKSVLVINPAYLAASKVMANIWLEICPCLRMFWKKGVALDGDADGYARPSIPSAKDLEIDYESNF